MKDKRSFFERLTGAVKIEDYDSDLVPDAPRELHAERHDEEGEREWIEEEGNEGQLTVDVFQNPNEIIIKSMVAGVKPEDLDISITRDMVTIKGKREGERVTNEEDYFHRELYWGSFSRTILLPTEIDVEESEAVEKHGLLIIRLPKINKDKQAKLRVKTN